MASLVFCQGPSNDRGRQQCVHKQSDRGKQLGGSAFQAWTQLGIVGNPALETKLEAGKTSSMQRNSCMVDAMRSCLLPATVDRAYSHSIAHVSSKVREAGS